jgi:ATP-binding cassette subfamily B (MDR/TAP) protein 1
MYTWIYNGEVNARRIREKYLRAILRQDVAFFDSVGAGEVTTRIQNDARKRVHIFSKDLFSDGLADLVQMAISEKVPLSLSYISAFVASFILAYFRSWRLGLALTSIFPWIAVTGAIMTVGMTKYSTSVAFSSFPVCTYSISRV